ncbi:MAG: hypothetical protein JXN10_06230, partial [Clostridia bacterium]|nr:hypothetical protein [Clostridia bacterium]
AETIFYDDSEQDLMVKLADQYGDAMNMNGRVNASVFNQNNGFVFTTDGTTTLTINPTEDAVEMGTAKTAADHTIYVFVYDPASQLQATATVLVIEAPYIAGISVGGFTWNTTADITAKTDTVRFYVNDTTALLDVECVDQYGDEYILTAADLSEGEADPTKVQVLVSNTNVISVDTVDLVDGDLKVSAEGTAGTALITLVLPSVSIIEQSDMITTHATPVLTSLEIAGPTETAYVGEEAKFGAVGYDQYDEEIAFDEYDVISFTSNKTDVLPSDAIDVVDEDTIEFTAVDEGTATVFVFLNGALQGQADITVNPMAYPYSITAVDAAEAMETGVSDEVESDDLTVIDQYGRTMDDPFTGLWSWEITAVTTQTHVALTNQEYFRLSRGFEVNSFVLSTAGLTAGTDTFVAYLTYEGEEQTESGFQFSVRNVDSSEIVAYSVNVVEEVLFSDYEYWNVYYQQSLYSLQGFAPEYMFDDDWYLDDWFLDDFLYDAPDWLLDEFNPYASQLIIQGLTSDLTEVALLHDESLIPTDIDLITFSMDEVIITEWPMIYDTEANMEYDYPMVTYPTIIAIGATAGTCKVTLWVNGVDVASDTVEVKDEAPYVASITAEVDELDGSTVDVYDYWTLPYDWFGFLLAENDDDFYFEDNFLEWFEYSYGDELESPEQIIYAIFMITLFDVEDQYGVDLARFPAMMDYSLRFSYSVVAEDDDSATTYFTFMTPEGTVWDTVKVTNADDLLSKIIDALDKSEK